MTTRPPSVLRSALTLLSPGFVLKQIGLGLFVFALWILWLRVPDASVIEVAGSVLLALLVVTVAGAGEASLILRVSDRARTPGRVLRGALLVLVGVALWFGWTMVLDHMRGDDSLRAGYLNSRFPASLRNFFSFEHLALWLGWMWNAIEWIGAGVIAIFVFAGTASARPASAVLRALRSITWWIALLIGTTLAASLTGSLVEWTPGHGLRSEMLSLVLRLGLAGLVDGAVACLLLAVLAVCVRRTDAAYDTPEGTPEESQPRTVENP